MFTLTLDKLAHDVAAQFDAVALRDKYPDHGPAAVAYDVTGKRTRGAVTARWILSGEYAPVHRPIDPADGYNVNRDHAVASYPSLSLSFGPRVHGTYVNTHTDAEQYPRPMAINGATYRDVGVTVRFVPLDVAGIYGADNVDTHPYGISTSNSVMSEWQRLTLDAARNRLATLDAAGRGHRYLLALRVPGTDGRRVDGVFVAEVDGWTSVTDSARVVLETVAIAVLRESITADVEGDWYDMLARDIRGSRDLAQRTAERWEQRVTECCDTLAVLNTSALASAGNGVEVTR
ncbi:hypothetical protein SEA_TRACKER_79 [Gordonia phage Tracker]|nr:hypothetical protein SEA_TRACKER_79 [Gordonia phage Tracker]